MAPSKRRRISGPSSTSTAKPNASQRTLSFGLTKSGASATANKVTKPFSLDNIGKVATKSLTTKDVLDVLTKDEPRKAQPQTTGKDTTLPPIDVESDAVFAETEEGKDCEEPEEDVAARALSERTINQYWQAKEIERKAPRVHQKGLSVREKVLREFDMSGSYGVSLIHKSRQLAMFCRILTCDLPGLR